MKRVIGFALFWVAVGIFISFLLTKVMIELIVMLICLLIAYNLFCC